MKTKVISTEITLYRKECSTGRFFFSLVPTSGYLEAGKLTVKHSETGRLKHESALALQKLMGKKWIKPVFTFFYSQYKRTNLKKVEALNNAPEWSDKQHEEWLRLRNQTKEKTK